MKRFPLFLVFQCILLSLLGCVIENKSARDLNAADMGMVSIDGGMECSNVCAADGCPNGTAVLDDLCRCVCEDDCAEIACDACPAGQVAVEQLGSCCPSCEPGCRTDDDCSDGTICTDGVCVDDCSLLDCAPCPDGYITGVEPTSCCDCTPACGPESPFTCNEGERCEDGICVESQPCEEVACEACPPGTQPVDSGGCCPDCEPVPCTCPDVEAPVCAEGVTYSNGCQAECDGFTNYRPGACDQGICGEDPNCGSTCDMVIECFDRECDTVNGREFLVDGCRQACRESGGAISDILCDLNSCEDVVDTVTELAEANFCGGTVDCDNPPPNVEYVEFGDACDTIRFECPPGGEYYRDECGCGCQFGGGSCEDFPPEGGYYVGVGGECEFIDFECGEGEDYFRDDCGCGCVVRDCDCPDFESPVCGPDGTQYRNECEAACAGAFGARPCEMACDCPAVYDPVCGLDSQTYDNACLAECVSVPVVHEGACFETDLCPNGFESTCEEVCGVAVSCYQQYCSEEEANLIATECINVCEGEDFPLQDVVCSFDTCEEVVGFLGPITNNPDACTVDRQDCPDRRNSVYYAQDPETCNLISFECEEGTVPFDNICGCGCTADLECPEEGREARYISRDTEVCERISLDCPEGSEGFSDDCGCGCLF